MLAAVVFLACIIPNPLNQLAPPLERGVYHGELAKPPGPRGGWGMVYFMWASMGMIVVAAIFTIRGGVQQDRTGEPAWPQLMPYFYVLGVLEAIFLIWPIFL